MKRAALYLRVSTLDQHPETQLHDLRALAAQRGFDIVREYTDRISGTRAKRPGLGELLHLLEQHAKHVVSLLGRRVPNVEERVAALQASSLLFEEIRQIRDRVHFLASNR